MTPQTRANPYVGPRAFQYGETLYGRDREVVELLDLLIAERIVLLYSPSGAGKTSLMQAGLIPELEKEGFHVLPVMRVSTEASLALDSSPMANRYILSLLLSLEEALPEEQQMPLAELAGMELADYLDRQQEVAGGSDSDVLIFDQFEEILTVDPTGRAAKEVFFAQVGAALRHRQRWALFAMREEYPTSLDPYLRPIPTRLSTTYRLELLGEDAAHVAVQRPARQAGIDFTDAAATKLINDLRRVRIQRPEGTTEEQLGLYVEPVQLQVVCRRLWERLSLDATQIGAEDVEAVGDVDSALEGYYAEQVIAIARGTGVRERAIREWFDRQLITEQGIRGQVLQGHEESQGLANRAIMPLVDAHLVRAEKRRGATWFELAHDRLIEPVRQNNAAWYQANLSALQRQAALWEEQHRSAGVLLHGDALQEAERWAAEHQDELTPTEHEFLEVCRQERARRRRRRATLLAIVGATALALATVSLLYRSTLQAEARAEAARDRAEQQARIATSRQLAAQAQEHLDDQLDLALLLSVEASRAHDTVEARSVLLTTLQYNPRLRTFLRPYAGRVHSIAFSRDGKTMLSASDPSIILWDVSRAQQIAKLPPDNSKIGNVAFSPGGNMVAAESGGQSVVLWDISSANPGWEMLGDGVSATFSPDGTILAVGGQRGTIVLWETASRQRIGELTREHQRTHEEERLWSGHRSNVLSVAFSPNGERLASGTDDGALVLWDVVSRKPLGPPLTLRKDYPRAHTSPVLSLAFSGDGETLASGGADGTIMFWNTATREPRGYVRNKGQVLSVSFSHDGKLLASGGEDRTVGLWDVANLRPADQPLTGYKSAVASVAFSSDGSILASGSVDGTIALWDMIAPEPLDRTLFGHKNDVSSVAFSPNDQLLASASADRTLVLWDVASRQPLAPPLTGFWGDLWGVTLRLHGEAVALIRGRNSLTLQDVATGQLIARVPDQGDVLSADLSSEGLLALGHGDGSVVLWNVANHEVLGPPLRGHESGARSVAFSPNGRTLASGDKDGTLILWDVSGRSLRHKIPKGHPDEVLLLGFSADGKTLASQSREDAIDAVIILWDAITGQPRGSLGRLRSLFRDVSRRPIEVNAAFSPDGSTLALAHDSGAIILWNLAAGRLLGLPLSNQQRGVQRVAISPDGKTLAVGSFGEGPIALWDITTRTLQGQLPFPVEAKRAHVSQGLSFSPDGSILAAHGDNTVVLWDVASRQTLEQRLMSHWDGLVSVAFSPDGKLLASGSRDTSIMLWDVATRRPLGRIPTNRDLWDKNLAFSPDGKILATGGCSMMEVLRCRQGEIRLWDVATRQALGTPLTGHTNDVESVAFSPDGKLLASGSEDTSIILWDVASRQPVGAPLTDHTAAVSSVAFSPDGKLLASGSRDTSIMLWDVATRQPLGAPLAGHGGAVSSVAFSPDGTVLASGSRDHDNPVLFWDVASRRPIPRPATRHTKPVKSVAFSSHGTLLASGAEDHTIVLWDMSIDSWQARACHMANRNLTQREWKQYMGDTPYRHTCIGLPIHPSLVEAGRTLARAGNIEAAVALLGRVQELEPGLALDPVIEANQLAASGLVEKGRQLARASDVEGAVALYRKAMELDPALTLDPQAEATLLAASGLVQQADSLLNAGNVDGASALYQQALTLNPHLDLATAKGRAASKFVDQARALAETGDIQGAVALFRRAVELDPALALNPEAEATKLAVSGRVTRGRHLGHIGNVEGATVLFQEALALAPDVDLTEAKRSVSDALMGFGQALAERGDVESAILVFQKVLEVTPYQDLDPQAEANKPRARKLLGEGQHLVKQGKVQEALATYAEAQTLVAGQISARDWNIICWHGSLSGHAAEVEQACEQAVTLAPEDGGIRDTRGLARALTGDVDGAIADFQAFIAWADTMERYAQHRAQRQRWISDLRAGKNPFTPEELEILRAQ